MKPLIPDELLNDGGLPSDFMKMFSQLMGAMGQGGENPEDILGALKGMPGLEGLSGLGCMPGLNGQTDSSISGEQEGSKSDLNLQNIPKLPSMEGLNLE